ncbi:hypothetical protein [Pseudomonas mucidolens]|uniref:Uncharacterized protein n=1 Tax=Pseudomonas mucidolens TaxID=46679 RepID=A0A1H2NFK9_9PSED|nr:hypothetical protein [Pseudomonas mucidolens]SDV04259.1 hypothetical protein SAMN05216202_3635 [Pseudomonas mucidolens]SQH32024.1 Uncharacterised protein [Pseudomonas mucidolens]
MKGKAKPITQPEWCPAREQSNELFREADRLDDKAYQLLSITPISAETAQKFHEAKNAARAKYLEARKAWNDAKTEP